tara:strand:+ start:1233 stop:1550 length:318 start_codon:yes stop_codon:yes gene_type:complete
MLPCLILNQFFSPEKRKARKRMAEYFNTTYDSEYKPTSVRLVEYNEDRMMFLVFYREYDPNSENYYPSSRPAQCFAFEYKIKQQEFVRINLSEADAWRYGVLGRK